MTRHSSGRGILIALVCGLAWWSLASFAIGGGEPWDAGAYWTLWYPGALLLAAILGLVLPRRSWAWGLVVMLAQLPVVAVTSGVGPLMLAGLVYACVLAIPAVAVSWTAGWWRLRARRRS